APGSQRLVRRMESRFNSPQCWTPDGRAVLLRTQGTTTRQDLIEVTLGDSVAVHPVLASSFNEPQGSISPDGRWLAYMSDESGLDEVHVRSFPDLGGRVIIVSRGAHASTVAGSRIGLPFWRSDGRELLYTAADG